MKSKPLSLNATDWPVIGAAFLVGLVLAVCEYVVQFATNTDFGALTPIVSGVVPPAVALIVRFIRDNEGAGR